MPDYQLPQVQHPDILGAFLRGQAAPGAFQEQQQQIQAGQLNLDQTRQALAFRQQSADMAQQEFQQSQQAQPSSAAPDASNDSWGVGKILGVDVPQANLASQAREHMAVAMGMNPVDAHHKEDAARKELLSTKVLDPTNPQNPIPTLINFANMPEGNAAALKANPGLFAQWEQHARQAGVDPAAIYSNDPAAADRAVRQVAHAMAFPVLSQIGKEGLLNKQEIPETAKPPPEITPYQKESLGLERRRLALQEKTSEGFGGKPGLLLAALTEVGASLPSGMRSKEQQLATVQGLLERHPDMTVDEIAQGVRTGKIDMTANTSGYTKFTSGKQGDTVRSLSVATSHLETLGTMVDALNNNDIKLLNKAGNAWQQQTGSSAPTNFDTVKNVVADEVTKAIIGYGGSVADREKAAAVIDRANSPAQLKGAIQTYKTLMGGQLQGLQRQYEKATGKKDFQSMLSPDAQQEIGGSSAKGVTPYADPGKEARYQAWKKAHPNG